MEQGKEMWIKRDAETWQTEKGADTLSGTGRGTGDQGEDWQENPYYYGTGGL